MEYTRSNLMRLKKADLLKLAEGIEYVDPSATKKSLVNVILLMTPPGGEIYAPAGPLRFQSIYPGKVIISDTPSGARYVWESPGAVLQVDEKDVDHLNSKTKYVRSV